MDSVPLPVMGSNWSHDHCVKCPPWGRDDVINGQYFSWTLNTRVVRAECCGVSTLNSFCCIPTAARRIGPPHEHDSTCSRSWACWSFAHTEPVNRMKSSSEEPSTEGLFISFMCARREAEMHLSLVSGNDVKAGECWRDRWLLDNESSHGSWQCSNFLFLREALIWSS